MRTMTKVVNVLGKMAWNNMKPRLLLWEKESESVCACVVFTKFWSRFTLTMPYFMNELVDECVFTIGIVDRISKMGE